jgi:signal transduction histidine kinase
MGSSPDLSSDLRHGQSPERDVRKHGASESRLASRASATSSAQVLRWHASRFHSRRFLLQRGARQRGSKRAGPRASKQRGSRAVWEQQFLDELKRYVDFGAEHAESLRLTGPYVEPSFKGIVDRFYEAIFANPRVSAVFTGGAAQIERQKTLLTHWLAGLFGGVYDLEYLRLRARIGRTHVRIRLPQRYMFSSMSIVRTGLHDALSASPVVGKEQRLAHEAIDKICDLELAIMLETYADDHLSRMRDAERLATLGQLSGFIGHELRNPLAVMETSIHLLRRRLPVGDEKALHHLNRLHEQVGLSTSIISDLLELARDRPLERHPIADLQALIDAALQEVPRTPEVNLVITLALDGSAPRLDEKQVRRLLVNLLTNAFQALSERSAGQVALSAQREDDKLLLVVEDDGPGISEEVRHRLFEPLATTRAKGLGLGLALCRRIAERHGGDIRAVRSQTLGGARFEVRLASAFGEEASSDA